jgi:hypothetical protein
MIKLYIAIFIVSLLAGVGYSAKYYYDTTQNTIATLRENNVKLETAVQAKDAAINQLETDAKVQAQLNSKLTKDLQKSEAYRDTLTAKLAKHNLTRDSLMKPGLVEKVINNATKNVFNDFRDITAHSVQ